MRLNRRTHGFLDNYSQIPRKVRPRFLSWDELRRIVYGKFPEFITYSWVESTLRDLWNLGAPDPATWERRLILPRKFQQWAHETGERIGREVLSHGR